MLILKEGVVVKSIAGHDKNTFHVIVKMEQDCIWIADGKARKLDSPKRKNCKHVAATKTVLDLNVLTTDKKLRAALWLLNHGPTPTEGGE